MNIYLIGFMGSGKSTVSKVLAEKLSWELIDTDEYIENKTEKSIRDIFADEGEEGFRNTETECIRDISLLDGKVVSCGGGAVLRSENVKLMKESGIVVLLGAAPETIFERVKHSTDRPILNGNMNVDYIAGLMEKRKPAYDFAKDIEVVTDDKTADLIADDIYSAIFENCNLGDDDVDEKLS